MQPCGFAPSLRALTTPAHAPCPLPPCPPAPCPPASIHLLLPWPLPSSLLLWCRMTKAEKERAKKDKAKAFHEAAQSQQANKKK